MAHKILVVDDEQDILKVVIFRLRKEGFEVDVASDGEEALNKIYQNLYSLIILDLLLPKIEGKEVCRRIKTDARYSSIPVILLTASAYVEDFESMAREIMADGYLFKPFEYEELLKKIMSFLEK